MIAAPCPSPPRLGPLAVPTEEDAAAAYPELRDRALTPVRAAELLGVQAARLLTLGRAGELLLVPAPWPVRQADQPGYVVPAWQLLPGGRGLHPGLPAVIAAAAEVGWTSLELHRFMEGPTPAALLRSGDAVAVAALIRGEPAPPPAAVRRRPRRRIPLHAPRRAVRRRDPRSTSTSVGTR